MKFRVNQLLREDDSTLNKGIQLKCGQICFWGSAVDCMGILSSVLARFLHKILFISLNLLGQFLAFEFRTPVLIIYSYLIVLVIQLLNRLQKLPTAAELTSVESYPACPKHVILTPKFLFFFFQQQKFLIHKLMQCMLFAFI